MSTPNSLEDLYWREFGAALRVMVAPGVVLAAACGAALTLTGAAAHGVTPAEASCQSCDVHPQLSQALAALTL